MKKHILTWLLAVSVCFMLVAKEKQNKDSIKIKKALKNLEQQIAFYKNDTNADKVLKILYEEKGNIYRHDGKYKEAYDCYLQVIKYAKKTKDIKHETEMVWFLVGLADAQNKPDLVLSLSKKFKYIIGKRFEDYQMRDYYAWKGSANLKKNQLDKALKDFQQVIKLLNKEGIYYKCNCTYFYSSISIVFSRKNNLKKSLEYLNKAVGSCASTIMCNKEIKDYFNKSLAIFEKCNPPNSIELSSLYQRLAKIDFNKERHKKYTLKAIKVLENINASKEKIASLYYQIGRDYPALKNKYYEKCINLLKGVRSNLAAGILFKLAERYYAQPEKSFELYQLTLKALPDSQKDLSVMAKTCHSMAKYFYERKKWQKLITLSKKCIKITRIGGKIKYRSDIAANCFYFLIKAYEAQGKSKQRIKTARDAVVFMRELKDHSQLIEAYCTLGKVYKSIEKYSDAEKSYQEIIDILKKHPYEWQKIDTLADIGKIKRSS